MADDREFFPSHDAGVDTSGIVDRALERVLGEEQGRAADEVVPWPASGGYDASLDASGGTVADAPEGLFTPGVFGRNDHEAPARRVPLDLDSNGRVDVVQRFGPDGQIEALELPDGRVIRFTESALTDSGAPASPTATTPAVVRDEAAPIGPESSSGPDAEGDHGADAARADDFEADAQRRATTLTFRDPATEQVFVLSATDVDGDGDADQALIDLDGNGRAEAIGYSRRGDGEIDKILVDTDGDGRHDVTLLYDRVDDRWVNASTLRYVSEDGTVTEAVGQDTDRDGLADTLEIDSDRNGKTDMWGFDRMGRDGQIDVVKKDVSGDGVPDVTLRQSGMDWERIDTPGAEPDPRLDAPSEVPAPASTGNPTLDMGAHAQYQFTLSTEQVWRQFHPGEPLPRFTDGSLWGPGEILTRLREETTDREAKQQLDEMLQSWEKMSQVWLQP